MATAYGTALGFESTSLLLALLLTQVVAFPFAILFGRLATKYNTSKLIVICIFSVFRYFYFCYLPYKTMAILGVSYFGRNVSRRNSIVIKILFYKNLPLEKSGEYFGLMDVCGKELRFRNNSCWCFITSNRSN